MYFNAVKDLFDIHIHIYIYLHRNISKRRMQTLEK